MADQLYNDTVMEHFENPRNVGEPERYSVKGEVQSPSCGDTTIIYPVSYTHLDVYKRQLFYQCH